jgi:hypothetical protein
MKDCGGGPGWSMGPRLSSVRISCPLRGEIGLRHEQAG